MFIKREHLQMWNSLQVSYKKFNDKTQSPGFNQSFPPDDGYNDGCYGRCAADRHY